MANAKAEAKDHAPVGHSLAQLARAHRQELERSLGRLGLHVGQERIVFEIGREPGVTQSRLAERMGVGQPTVAKALSRMESGGFVRQERDAEDGRAARLFLTGSSEGLVGEVARCWRALDERMGAGMSAEERATLARLLVRARENLEENQR